MGDLPRRKSWDIRYKSKGQSLAEPEPFLVDNLHLLKAGSVLDLASGDGRNALFLARNGFQVTAVDFSEVALKRMKLFAGEHLPIKMLNLDLNHPDCLQSLDYFDNIVSIHYKLKDELLEIIPDYLKKNGLFLYNTFNIQQHHNKAFSEKYCLQPAALVNRSWQLKMITYESYQNEHGYQDGYLFQKK